MIATFAGRGEAILIVVGVAAALTGLYSLIFKRRSWAAISTRKLAAVVTFAGVASFLVGSIADGVSASQEAPTPMLPATSAQLEADAAAKLKIREDAVAARESAAVVAAQSAAKTFGQRVWTVGKDIEPGDYRTTKAVVDCDWKITRTGSNGGDYIDYDYNVTGGFPLVSLVDGHTFDSDGCGEWAKQ